MQKERLLIIDDDEAFTASISGIAALADYEVMTTGDPVVARALIGAWRPSMLIVDLLMAATHGARLLRPLAAEGCATQVIISSGLGDSAPTCALDIATQHGCKIAGFLSKPLQSECCRNLLVQTKFAKDLTLTELREAFTQDQFFLEYQPQLDCRFNKIVGVEALVRWHHPEKGIIPPNQFIPLAAETELVDELTDWVFSAATKQVARWHDQGLSLQLAVNISVRNIENDGFARRLTKHCNTVGLEPRSVTLEIAEGNLLPDTSTLLKGLYELQFEEFGVAIDEFGTGYSSLVELRRLPLTAIKIDRSLVSRITNDSDCQRTVAIIADIARKLELEAIAVGVENEQALSLIRAFGCGRSQGYHISRPVPSGLIPQTIDEWKSRSEQAVA